MTPETESPPRVWVIRSMVSARARSQGLLSGIRAIEHADALSAASFLSDLPWITGDTLRHLVSVVSSERIVIPIFRRVQGTNLLLKQQFWQTLRLLVEDFDEKDQLQLQLVPHPVGHLELSDIGNRRSIEIEEPIE